MSGATPTLRPEGDMTTSTLPLDIDSFLAAASVEISSRGHEIKELRAGFSPGTDVTITFLPGDDYHHNIETAAKLRKLGFNPVPHIAARGLQSTAALDDFLTRVRGEADVTRVLLVAGDIAMPRGPYASTLDLCRSGLVERHGIERVTIAGHPEGHPQVDQEAMFSALAERREWARGNGIALDMITQFCFQAGPILALVAALEARDLRMPVTIGLAGPATPATLIKFALRCGVGASIRAVRGHIGRFSRLLVDEGPDEVVQGLVAAAYETTTLVAGLHLYPLGGMRKAAAWRRARVAHLPTPVAGEERRR